ncbi:MAG: nucleotidyltransferase family protein [Candidatus Omnitrophota bacterium]
MKKIDLYPALDFSFSQLADEEKLVVFCSRTTLPEGSKKEVRSLIRSGLDWDYFLTLAKTYRVTPFVHKHFQPFLDEIPGPVKQKLREHAGYIFASNIKGTENLRYITKLFREKDIEVLFIKGARLMFDIYKERGLRLFTDIDILAKDFRRTGKILKDEGFKPYESRGIFSHYRAQRMYELNGKIYLDVHKDFIGRMLHSRMLNIDRKKIWADKKKISQDGIEFYAMDLVHTLLYLSLHVSLQHSFSGLIWYVDIHELVEKRGDEIDWREVLKLAGEYKIKRPVYYTLLFTKRMFGTPVPDHVFDELKKVERKLDWWVFKKIKSRNAETDYFAELAMFDSMADTIKFILISLIIYPYLIPHFLRIFAKMLKFRPS